MMATRSGSSAFMDAALAQICKEAGEDCRDARCRRRRDIDLPRWSEGCVGAVAVGDRDRVFSAGVLEFAHRADEPIERLFGAGGARERTEADLPHRRAPPSLKAARAALGGVQRWIDQAPGFSIST